MEAIWIMAITSLGRSCFKHPVRTEAFVLMSNHYHLLLYTPNSDLDKFMHSINSMLSKEVRQYTGRINRVFGDRYKWCLINSESYYQNVIRYIFQNPIRAEVSKTCESYPYSTLYYQNKKRALPFRLPEHFVENEYLKYINAQIKEGECLRFRKEIQSNKKVC